MKKPEAVPVPGGPVAVVGVGLIGASWAALFAAHGRTVMLYDQDPGRLAAGVETALDDARYLVEQGLAGGGSTGAGLGALEPCQSLAAAVVDACFVQEAVPESYAVKEAVFQEADRHAPPSSLIVTSTSYLSITRIQSAARHPQRCLAGHPYNPPHLIPLVEIVPGERTAPQSVEAARLFYRSVGKEPVVLRREVPGYLANRMSAALWREAINLVLDGVASVADVDRAIRYGPGLRWAVMGPHLLYHLGGGEGGIRRHIEHLGPAKEETWADLNDWKAMPAEAPQILESGLPELEQLPALACWRDEVLTRVLKAAMASGHDE
jgi:carnitine 3-dehydrogenase